jgi:transglutaminase-like putative cysteine protease
VIDKPVNGVRTDARPHPAGRKGARLSLKEVAERAWKARMSPRLRAWVTQQLNKCGVSTGGRRAKAQCVLDAFRKKVPYIADPVMGEFMATPDQTLCLDEGGLCFLGGDCDDHSIGLAAAMMSIGVEAMIVGISHREPYDTPTHVFMAFKDDLGDWVKMDGTTKLPVGIVAPHAREWWVEPGQEAKDRGEGDFVGMSDGATEDPGVLDGPATTFDLLYPGIR